MDREVLGVVPIRSRREVSRRMGAKPRRGRLAVLIAVVITAMVTLAVGGPAAAGPLADLARVAAPPFADVAPGAPFFADIQWLYDQGISTGSVQPDGTVLFQPAAPVRREAMAAFLYRFAGSPAFTPPVTSPFVDVATTGPFYKEIAWLAAKHIATGTDLGDGTFAFRPTEPVSREAMAAFLHRTSNLGYAAYAWGRNDYGQLGDGTTTNKSTP